MRLEFSTHCYNPDANDTPRMQDYTLEIGEDRDVILLDVLIQLKEKGPSLSSRRSYREGVYGSDGLNMNGRNGLACIAPISALNQPGRKTVIRPLPGLPVICNLVINMGQSYVQCEEIKSYLLNNGQNPSAREHLQVPEQREKFNRLYECILCACYSTSCPFFWWNPSKFIGPADLLAVYRLLIDSRNTKTDSRLDGLSDAFSVFRYHSITNYISVCPKGLNPTRTVGYIRSMLSQRSA